MEKKPCKARNFYILLAFLLITIAFLTSISIYCYLIKYLAKQKHLLPFHDTKEKFQKFCVNNMFLKNGNLKLIKRN